MRMKLIAVVMKDAGSFNAVMPAGELLSANCGHDYGCVYFASGVAATKLKERDIPYQNADEFVGDSFDLVLCGTSSTADGDFLERDICRKATAKGIPIVAISDVWMSALRLKDDAVKLTVVTSIDQQSTSLLRQVMPGVKIVTTGNPAFDQWFHGQNQYTTNRSAIRERLGLHPKEKLVCFFGGYGDQSADILQLLCDTLGDIGSPYLAFAVRNHPAILQNPKWAKDKAKIEATLADFFGRTVDTAEYKTGESLLPAADLCVANWSTLLLQATHLVSLHGSPMSLHIILPEYDQGWIANQFCGLSNTVPAVTLGAAKAVYQYSPADVATAISNLLFNENTRHEITRAAKRDFRLDGRSTERVAAEVIQLLN